MSDEQNNDQGQGQEPAEAAKPAAAYTEADIARILEADRAERGAAAPQGDDDPVARFRASTHGTKLYAQKKGAEKPAAAEQPTSKTEALLQQMLTLQVMSMTPPKPPAPPKPMSVEEKLSSNDPDVWLRRGSPNTFTAEDRRLLVAEHARKLSASGYRGFIEREAEALAARDIANAGMRALKNIKLVPDGIGINLPIHPGLFRK